MNNDDLSAPRENDDLGEPRENADVEASRENDIPDALEDDPDDEEGVYIPPYLFSSQTVDLPSRRRVRVLREQGRRVLTVDGVVQSIEVREGEATPGYWKEMIPAAIGSEALLLGYGGGTIAHILLGLQPTIRILAIDDDPTVVQLAQSSQYLRLHDERLEIELADAFASVKRFVDESRRFDTVAVDLYRALAIARAAFSRPFLRRIAQILTPNGYATFNLQRDGATARRIRKIGQYLRVERTALVGMNCVVHARRYR